MRHFLQLRIQLFPNEGRHISYPDLEMCTNVFESFLNRPAPLLFVSDLPALTVHKRSELRKDWVTRVDASAEFCRDSSLNFGLQRRKIG